MKIGIDARLWSETGVGRYIRNLVKELIILDQSNEYVLFVLAKDIESIKCQIANSKSNKWKLVSADIRWHSLSEQLRFNTILYKEQLDLMHFPYFSLPILYKRSFVITLHDLIIHHFATGKASTLPLPLYYAKRFFYKRVIIHGVKQAKCVIVPLEAVKKDLVETLGVPKKKIIVTKEGFDASIRTQNSELTPQKLGRYLLYVGNAYPHKNLEFLLEAFQMYKTNNATDTVKLVLVGKEDYFYKRLKNKVGAQKDAIVFLHNVTDAELASLYKNAVAFISASKMEGFGLPPLEAMANNCLVVVSDIPSFREVCQNSALYFDQNNATAIAEKIKIVLSLTDREKKGLRQKGKEIVTHFSWEEMGRQTLAVYESCFSL